jgi:hypothetical protein
VVEVRRSGRLVELVFAKRLDLASGGGPAHYALDEGSVTAAKVDGHVVELSLSRVKKGRRYELTVKEISDAADRRLIRDQAPAVLKLQTVRFRHRPAGG